MTVVKRETQRATGNIGARKLVTGFAFALVGIAAGFGIAQLIDLEGDSALSGPLVDRSVAMQGNIDALVESGQAQAAALAQAAAGYSGPLVERSLAMNRFYGVTSGGYSGPLVDRSLAMDRFYGVTSGGYSGPLVDRSLAMDRMIDVLIENGRAQAAALGGSE